MRKIKGLRWYMIALVTLVYDRTGDARHRAWLPDA